MSSSQGAGPAALAAGNPALPPLARMGATTLAEQLAARFADRIRQRLLAPGAKLPSVRDCATRHGVSPSTVVGAYDLLQAQGLVQARPQRGFFVREEAPRRTPTHTAASASRSDAAAPAFASAPASAPPSGFQPPLAPAIAPVDATALIRGMFRHRGAGYKGSPGLGTLPEAWLDAPLLARALRRASSAGASASWLSYGEPAGDPRLRAALARRLADMGIAAAPEQIVTTLGATHALDLVARTLLTAGDAVLVDDPGWAVEFARLTQLGMRLLPVPRGAEGPDLAVMRALAQAHRPRLYVTVSVLHNPTGASLTPAAAHQVLKLAEEFDFTVVEDDTYAWLAEPQAARLAQLDALSRTVYVSGFSKVLVPQWRVGFLAAAPVLVERVIDSKLLSSLTTPALLEQAVASCLEQGSLRRHAERVTARLALARTHTMRLAEEAGCAFVAPPAGLFGWIDTGVDTEWLAQALLDEGWFTAPGRLFHAASTGASRLMRINFATAQEPRFWQRLAQLRERHLRTPGYT